MAEDAAVADAEAAFNEEEDPIDEEIMSMTTEEIRQRTRHLDEQVRICKATPSPPAPPPPRPHFGRPSCNMYALTRSLACAVRTDNSEIKRLQHETASQKEKIKDNIEKIKLNKQVSARSAFLGVACQPARLPRLPAKDCLQKTACKGL